MRRIKIIATLGPASDSRETITSLLKAGVDVFRFNMSHATHEWVERVNHEVRELSNQLNRPVGLMVDTQGPEIRTGNVKNDIPLKPGDIFTFTVRGHVHEEEHSVDVNYEGLINDINLGDVVFVDGGVIRMKVLEKSENKLRCEVLTPGTMTSRRHINLPGVRVNLPALTEIDKQAIDLALRLKMDFVAVSFVRDADDVQAVRDTLAAHPSNHVMRIYAKIEDQSAVRNLDAILSVADGVMVARGDLGIECPFEDLPNIQRNIVRACLRGGQGVIVATQMLESMIVNPLPTRAEVTDVANAVFEQADCIMLSGETSVGRYPVACVDAMDRIARRTEREPGAEFAADLSSASPREALISSAVFLANKLRADAILVFTKKGRIASQTASHRPTHSPIFAFSPDPHIVNRLSIRWGVTPIQMDFSDNRDETVAAAIHKLTLRKLISPGATLVVLSDILAGDEVIDTVQLRFFR